MKTFDWDKVIIAALAILLVYLCVHVFRMQSSISGKIQKIEEYDAEMGKYRQVFYDEELKSLQTENKALYDSIAKYKNEVTYVTQFKYITKHTTDTVYLEKNSTNKEDVKEFKFSNGNDTLKYELTLGSTIKPNWYKFDFEINDQLMLVNRKIGDVNETTIQSANNGIIEDATIFTPKQKRGFKERFAVGPSVTVGYDIFQKNVAVVVGVSATFDITK